MLKFLSSKIRICSRCRVCSSDYRGKSFLFVCWLQRFMRNLVLWYLKSSHFDLEIYDACFTSFWLNFNCMWREWLVYIWSMSIYEFLKFVKTKGPLLGHFKFWMSLDQYLKVNSSSLCVTLLWSFKNIFTLCDLLISSKFHEISVSGL